MGLRGPARRTRGTVAAASRLPKPLSAKQPAEVRRLIRRLASTLPAVTEADEVLLEGLAQAVYLRNVAFTALHAEATFPVDTDHGGELKRHPAWLAWRTADEQALKAATRLGGSPLDRQRIPEVEEKLDVEAYNAELRELWGPDAV